MDLQIQGRRALVLGASRGLGAAIARTLAAEGVHVLAAGRTAERLQAVVSEIQAAGGSAEAFPLDLADEAGLGAALDRLAGPDGAPSIDILVNNSGGPPPARFRPSRPTSGASSSRAWSTRC